jgi:isochorismate synthase EntC
MKEKAASEASINWAKRWINLCTAIDSALSSRNDKLEATKAMHPTVSVASSSVTAADGER